MKNSTEKMIISVLLTISLMTGATLAQEKDKRGNNTTSWYEYDGVETSAGTLDSINAILWGDTFVLQSRRGSQINSLNLSINSSATRVIPIDGEPQAGDQVLSGNWSLIVIKEKLLVGILYGEITGGITNADIRTAKDSTVRQTEITLRTTGGTGAFEQIGKQHIIGTFSAATNYIGGKRFINGALSFNF